VGRRSETKRGHSLQAPNFSLVQARSGRRETLRSCSQAKGPGTRSLRAFHPAFVPSLRHGSRGLRPVMTRSGNSLAELGRIKPRRENGIALAFPGRGGARERCTADPGSFQTVRLERSRVSSAPFHAALRPGTRSSKSAARTGLRWHLRFKLCVWKGPGSAAHHFMLRCVREKEFEERREDWRVLLAVCVPAFAGTRGCEVVRRRQAEVPV
jgi:hypothetical protein